MQMNERTGELGCILSMRDLGNLRLTNRQTSDYVEHAFGIRGFRYRKHMFSENSLEALIGISRHNVFSRYVHTVSLGPERISDSMPQFIRLPGGLAGVSSASRDSVDSAGGLWYSEPAHIAIKDKETYNELCLWHKVNIRQQEIFLDSDKGGLLLREALENLANLRVIRVESYPENAAYGEHSDPWTDWNSPWGVNSLLQELEVMVKSHRVDARKLFLDATRQVVNWHLAPILESLDAIKDRPSWKLHFYLNSSEKYLQTTNPIDIESHRWQVCTHRVRRVNLYRSIQTMKQVHVRANWLTKLLESCGQYLEELSFQNAFWWSKLVCDAPLSTLRRLHVVHAPIQDSYFDMFLARHADSLESIKLSSVTLSMDKYLQMRDNEIPFVVLQSDKYEREDPSWIAKFELMLRLGCLRKIHLEHLMWWESMVRRKKLFSDDESPQTAGSPEQGRWKTTATAEGDDIKTVLSRAIRDNKICYVDYNGHWMWEVVFLEENIQDRRDQMDSRDEGKIQPMGSHTSGTI